MEKEYMMSIDELKTKYPISSLHQIDGKMYKVVNINEPMTSNCLASFPKVIFEQVKI